MNPTRRQFGQWLGGSLIWTVACGKHPSPAETDTSAETDPADSEAADTDESDPPDSPPDTGDGWPEYTWEGDLGPEDTFNCGVASGDPTESAILLWTFVNTEEATAAVFLEVATDEAFEHRIFAGEFEVSAESGNTLTVDQTGLNEDQHYYYRFYAFGRMSPTGRTKTAGARSSLKLAICSCSAYAWGYFHAYRLIAQRTDLDAVVHLGDYIYEHAIDGFGYSFGNFRAPLPFGETLTLSDYRLRYRTHRLDPDLQELHRLFPMIHVWDDHEFANGPYIGGASNHDSSEGSWEDRKAAAVQAYTEFMPTRLGTEGRIFRTTRYGDLAQLTLVDRHRRFLFPAEGDEGYLGTEQGNWLDGEIQGCTSRWFLLGTGCRFALRTLAEPEDDPAIWDADSRNRVLDGVAALDGTALAVLTGDAHRFDALDVVRDPSGYDPETGSGAEAVEWCCGSITSPGGAGPIDGVPQYRWSEASHRGYLLLEIDSASIVASFYGFADPGKEAVELPSEDLRKRYSVPHDSPHLIEVD